MYESPIKVLNDLKRHAEREKHDAEVRAKAFDEFAKKLIERLEAYEHSNLAEWDSEECLHCKENRSKECCFRTCGECVWDKALEIVNQLAEQLKAGGKHE